MDTHGALEVSDPESPTSDVFYFTLSVNNKKNPDKKRRRAQDNSPRLLDGARFMFDVGITPVASESSMERVISTPVKIEQTPNFRLSESSGALELSLRNLAPSINRPTTSPKLKRIQRREGGIQWSPPGQVAIRNKIAATPPTSQMPWIKLGFSRNEASSRAIIAEKKWKTEKRHRMRQNALALGPLIREIEKKLWAAKKLPLLPQPGINDGIQDDTDSVTTNGTVIKTTHDFVPFIASPKSNEVEVESGDENHLAEGTQSVADINEAVSLTTELGPHYVEVSNLAVSTIGEVDIKRPVTPTAKATTAAKRQPPDRTSVASACNTKLGSRVISQSTTRESSPRPETTTVKPKVSTSLNASPTITVETPTKRPHPRTTPPHLRKPPPSRANPLPKRDILGMSLAAAGTSSSGSTASTRTSKQPASSLVNPLKPSAVRQPNYGFRIPKNPHIAGYNMAAVVGNPRAKIDVKGLKFSAWPQPINRGDQPIQEPRTVIITNFSALPTFATVTRVCCSTGKIENIMIDESRKMAHVTFMHAQVAHDFYTATLGGLEHVAAGQTAHLYVKMDYPVDMLSYVVQERGATRMIIFANWDKRDVECVLGLDHLGDDLESLIMRLADKYVPGRRVEGVTVEEQGWEYFNGTILFAGIMEAMDAFDALSAETQFKGCRVAFGRDP